MEAKLKHLEFVQSAIDRMAKNSSLYKGWAVTIAAGLYALGASNGKSGLLIIAGVSTVMFWGLDAYYLWLERGFICRYNLVRRQAPEDVDFDVTPVKDAKRWKQLLAWVRTCWRPHLWLFYLPILVVEVVGIFLLNGDADGTARFFQL